VNNVNVIPSRSTFAFKRRSLLLTIVGLLLVLAIAALPTLFYYWDPNLPDDHKVKQEDAVSTDFGFHQLISVS
jgi:hypothetical protein